MSKSYSIVLRSRINYICGYRKVQSVSSTSTAECVHDVNYTDRCIITVDNYL